MVFVSDRQRKFVMAKLRQGKAIVEPTIVKLSSQQKAFIRKKVSKNIKEGKPPKQAVAISFSQARKKFGLKRSLLRKRTGALLSSKERVAITKLKRIIPKLNKKQTEELRKIVLKKLKTGKARGRASLPANPPKIPLINLIPLLIGTFVILSVLKASQDIFKKRKKN